MIEATLTPIVAPLVAELAVSRQTIERQTDELRTLEREDGRQAAELEPVANARTLSRSWTRCMDTGTKRETPPPRTSRTRAA
jgi:hypothetical protein